VVLKQPKGCFFLQENIQKNGLKSLDNLENLKSNGVTRRNKKTIDVLSS
jgi:hypothetical protein